MGLLNHSTLGKRKPAEKVMATFPQTSATWQIWPMGYNYAYHLGDLSAVTCTGHPVTKSTRKYKLWCDKLFTVQDGHITPRTEVLFWATLWDENCPSIWQQYGATKLAFEEYLVIGVASDVFPDSLLNHEGRTR